MCVCDFKTNNMAMVYFYIVFIESLLKRLLVYICFAIVKIVSCFIGMYSFLNFCYWFLKSSENAQNFKCAGSKILYLTPDTKIGIEWKYRLYLSRFFCADRLIDSSWTTHINLTWLGSFWILSWLTDWLFCATEVQYSRYRGIER